MSYNGKMLRSGIWYTAANFVMKSIAFITTPIFTRIMTHADFGMYNNFTSWMSTFSIFLTLNLDSTFISARYDFQKDFDRYILSTLTLSSVWTIAFIVFATFIKTFLVKITGLKFDYLVLMGLYLFFLPAVSEFQVKERYNFKYRVSVGISLFTSISSILISLLLIIYMRDPLLGRIIGSISPVIAVGIVLYMVIIYKGQRVEVKYWKYALPIALPYIPHLLSMTLLNSADKMMITQICGAEENALYSVAYNCGAIVSMLITSMNMAFSPWLGEKLSNNDYSEIKKVSKYYVSIFAFLTMGMMLVSPEILLIMGGKNYIEAKYVMPPVAFGCVCQFLYTMYVNIEQFYKKTVGMATASILAALINYVLNRIFIPSYGYIAASYTTLFSFMCLLFFHMLLVKQMHLLKVYSTKFVFSILIGLSVMALCINLLYSTNVIRYIIIMIYIIVIISVCIKKNLIGLLIK